MDVVFLDANVLFSAAWRGDSGLARLWHVEAAELITSDYAAVEARRNLERADQVVRLDALLPLVRIVPEVTGFAIDTELTLPEKDRPILRAAIAARATHLLTGDVTHFGPLFGQRVRGMLIQTPAEYLRSRM